MKSSEAKALLAGREYLIEHYRSRNPRGGRAAAVAEFDRQAGPVGRQRLAEAQQAIARKAAKRAARESAIRQQITESLTAASASEPPAAARAPSDLSKRELADAFAATMAASSKAATWKVLGAGLDVPVIADTQTGTPPAPDTPLHELSSDDLRTRAKAILSTYADERGLGSQAWKVG